MSEIKNYSSSVSVERSIMMIEQCLIDAGATNISKTFNEQKECNGLYYQILYEGKFLTFKLPARIESAYKRALDKVSPKNRFKEVVKKNCREQAKRTAWKLLYDWVSVNYSLIKLDQIDLLQTMLAYTVDYSGKTLYEKLKENDFKLLEATK